jgi:hypothetical protein
MDSVRAWLEQLEEGGDAEVPLAFVAGQRVTVDDDELSGARRRAMLLLAAGGDPHRELDPNGRAVTSLAADLDSAERRAELAAGLEYLRPAAAGLHRVEEALARLTSDRDLAWHAFACALLADELSDE